MDAQTKANLEAANARDNARDYAEHLDELQRAVMDEWGFDWRRAPAVKRILGEHVYARLYKELGGF